MRRGWSFSLSSLMLIVACAAGCAWVGAAVPALGILCAVLAIPALIRTGQLVAREAAERHAPIGVGLKVLIFFESLLGMCWIGVVSAILALGSAAAGFAASAAACSLFTRSGETCFLVGLWLGIVLGFSAAIATLVFSFRVFWSQRHVYAPSESKPRP